MPERLPTLAPRALLLAVAGGGIWFNAGLISSIFAAQRPFPVHIAERDPGEVALRLNHIPMFSMAAKQADLADFSNNFNGIELLGVVSPPIDAAIPESSSGGGWAVLRMEGERGRLVMVGEELRPGLHLLQVRPEAVVLEGGTSRSQFEIALRREARSHAAGQPAVAAGQSVEVRKVIETKDM